METAFSFTLFDYILDNYHFLYNSIGLPKKSIKATAAVIASFAGLAFSYPFFFTLRSLVEIYPKNIS